MIIDFHTHTFPKKIVKKAIKVLSEKADMAPSTDGTREGLLASMKKAGIDYSVEFAVATSPSQVPALNRTVISETGSVEGLIFFGSMHPDYDNYIEELQLLKNSGVKGIKIHPAYQDCPLNDDRFLRIFDECEKLGLIVISHGGLDIGLPGVDYCSPVFAKEVIARFPELVLVMAHMGGWRQWEEAKEYLANTSIYIDSSFSLGRINPIPGITKRPDEESVLMKKEEFESMVRIFNHEKILFGTDSPWADQLEAVSLIKKLNLPSLYIEDILGNNAERILFKRF